MEKIVEHKQMELARTRQQRAWSTMFRRRDS
jgi:hypothetical protein